MSEGQSSSPASVPGAGLGRLTEQEQKLIAKLLSDPTFFPIEFRTWLKQFIEGSGIIITASQIQGGSGTNVATGLPAGVILPVSASGAVPADCLACDGSAKVRTDYPILFGRIGVAWGAGDGSTTFNLPDLRDRALYGAGGWVGVAATDGVAYGSRGGPNHHHDINQSTNTQGSHSHGGSTDNHGGHSHRPTTGLFLHGDGTLAVFGTGTPTSNRYLIQNYSGSTTTDGAHSHGLSTDSQGSHSHNLSGPTNGGYGLVPSFAGVIYVITIGTAA